MHPIMAAAARQPQLANLVISVVDWQRFGQFCRDRDSAALFETLDAFYKLVERHVAGAGGRTIKHSGDSSLIVFAGEAADQAVACLLELKRDVDAWFVAEGIDSRLQVNVHVGEAMIGPMGGSQTGHMDLVGEAVNLAFTLGSRGFVLSPQAFRSLGTEMRRHFKKHTPPIVYLAAS